MKQFFSTPLYLMIVLTYCEHQQERRDPKWFLSTMTITSLVLQRRLITEMMPSSCAVVESTLPPCRNVRRLDIRPTSPRKILATEAPEPPAQMLQPPLLNKKPSLEPSSDTGTWFWGGVSIITQVLVSDVTVKVQDPNTVVTFSVKGCKPTRLPFDLPLCTKINYINETKTSPVQTLRTADLHYIQD